MAGPLVSVGQSPDHSSHSLHAGSSKGDLSILILPFTYNRPVSYDLNNGDVESTGDDFDSCDEENNYPSEFDFLDQKHGQICRRNGEKKLSVAVKAKRKYSQRDTRKVISSSKGSFTGSDDSDVGLTNKELRIREIRIENTKRKRENKIKAKKRKGVTEKTEVQSEKEKKPLKSCLRKSVRKNPVSVCANQTANPPSFYNNSDFILNSNNNGVKFEDQSYINLLIELQNREITPEDYDLLLQLDSSVQPKTLSTAQIKRLSSDKVTSEIDDLCSICIEDYVSGDERNFLPCGHHFHSFCIKTWLGTTSDRCPIDGKEVR